MGKTSFHFLTTFFSMTLFIFILVNFLGWSGLSISGLVGVEGVGWGDNRYFGFNSFLSYIRSFGNNEYEVFGFNAKGIYSAIKDLTNYVMGNLPNFVTNAIKTYQGIMNGTLNAVTGVLIVIRGLLEVIFSPFIAIGYAFVLFVRVLGFVAIFIGQTFMAISGVYNSTFVPSLIL